MAQPSAWVVTVGSRLHMPGSRGKPVDFDFDDFQLEHGYNPDRAYKNSKLAVLWFTYELQRRLESSPIERAVARRGPGSQQNGRPGSDRWVMIRPSCLWLTSAVRRAALGW